MQWPVVPVVCFSDSECFSLCATTVTLLLLHTCVCNRISESAFMHETAQDRQSCVVQNATNCSAALLHTGCVFSCSRDVLHNEWSYFFAGWSYTLVHTSNIIVVTKCSLVNLMNSCCYLMHVCAAGLCVWSRWFVYVCTYVCMYVCMYMYGVYMWTKNRLFGVLPLENLPLV